MDQIGLRTFNRLRYKDPRAVLVDLRRVELDIPATDIDARVKHLRTSDLRHIRELNPTASVQEVVNKLKKYPASANLTVVLHLNRVTQFTPSELIIPRLGVAAIWVFGATSPDQSRWAIWGNFLDPEDGWQAGEFRYPT